MVNINRQVSNKFSVFYPCFPWLKTLSFSLFNLDFDILLYDVTSTYFEGQCNGNSFRYRCKDRRVFDLIILGKQNRF